jgi:2-succinyl-6-hydroxy-2,4-cyclohexadiene-1-carboxylate synthase
MIVALHGFLGLPSDWDFLRAAGFEVTTPPLDDIPPEGEILLGYSMGGRLALHALLAGARYRRAIIVSAGLGIEAERDRAERRIADDGWARRFQCDQWNALMRDWDAQSIFGGHRMPRDEDVFDRKALASALCRWSPAALPPLAPRLPEIDVPVLWITGERDPKYTAEGRRAISLLPNSDLWICPGAAHRVPWEQPEAFIERLRALL